MSKDLPNPQQSEEVDLGQLFKLIGNAFQRLIDFISSIFKKLFLAFVWLVFFVKKHFIKIALAGIIGFSLGYLKERLSAPSYRSAAIIKQNYNTGEILYEAIEYYDKLVSESDTLTLANTLNIEVSKATKISDFDVEAVTNDDDRVKAYDNYIKGLDSVVASTITYETYLEISKEFNIPFQKIIIDSKSNESYGNVFAEIIDQIKTSPYFVAAQTRDLNELQGSERLINETLSKSDSLQSVYTEVLRKSVEGQEGSQTSISIDNTEDKSVTKEFELYQSDLLLRRELVDIQRKVDEKSKIIEIVSIEKERGVVNDTKEILGFNLSKPIFYCIVLALLVFLLLLVLDFLKFLERFREKV